MSEQSDLHKDMSLFQRMRQWLAGDTAEQTPEAPRTLAHDHDTHKRVEPTQPGPPPASQDANEVETIVQQAIAGLEKQISRAGREQLKANSLAETQLERLTAALELLKADDARRNAEMEALRQQNSAAQAAARLEVVQAMLPALDGLDAALRSGQAILDKPLAATATPTIFERMRDRAGLPPGTSEALRDALHSWLVGLVFVRQRLLDALEAEGVTPIAAQGHPFDPQLHIVLDVVPATDGLRPGVVAAELRRGYLVGTRVLRHAEVTVARAMRSVGT